MNDSKKNWHIDSAGGTAIALVVCFALAVYATGETIKAGLDAKSAGSAAPSALAPPAWQDWQYRDQPDGHMHDPSDCPSCHFDSGALKTLDGKMDPRVYRAAQKLEATYIQERRDDPELHRAGSRTRCQWALDQACNDFYAKPCQGMQQPGKPPYDFEKYPEIKDHCKHRSHLPEDYDAN